MTADITTLIFPIGNAEFTVHLQSGFFSTNGKRWKVLHCHPDYEIHFFEKGEFDFYSGGRTLHVSAPSALILPPLVYHSFYSESENAERVCLLFDLKKSGDEAAYDEYLTILSSLSGSTVIPNFVSSFSRFRNDSETLRPFEAETLIKNEISAKFIEIFSRLRTMKGPELLSLSSSVKNDKNRILADIFKYIEDHFSKCPTPGDLAKELYVSQRHIERLLKTELQTTFTGLLNRCRIENVCKQIDSSASCGQLARIAEESGFPDYSTFWRNFKKHTGKSPSEYLKSI